MIANEPSQQNPASREGPVQVSRTASSAADDRRRARWRNRLVVAVLFLSAAVFLRLTLFRAKPIPVTVSRVDRGHVEESVTNSRAGTVKSRHRATLGPEIGGRVEKLFVKKGDRVSVGSPLLKVADGDLRAGSELQSRSLDAARAAERESCEAAALAERELQRSLDLFREKIVSNQIVDQLESRRNGAVSSCSAARARTRQAEAALDLAQFNLSKSILKAPFAGIVAEVSAEVGEWITPSPPGIPIPPVVELIDPDSIYISAPLDEVDVARVRPGLPVRVTLDSYPGKSFPGRLSRVAPYVLDRQEQNRTFEIEVVLDDASFSRQLLPGTSADVEVILGVHENVLRVPSYAVVGGKRVLVVKDGVIAEAEVETGLRNWAFTEIVKGLAAGDSAVVSLDRPEVKAGARVKATPEKPK